LPEMDPNLRRETVRPKVIGISFAVLVHVVLLTALAWGVRVNTPSAPTPIVDVQVLKPWPKAFPSAPNRSAEAKRVEQPTRSAQDKSPLTAPIMPGAPASPPSIATALRSSGAPGSPETWLTGNAHLSSALRNSLIGCADADATKLSEGEREGCRQRLAEGASTASYISGVPAAKREYYQALQVSEDAMMRDPMGGHRPGIGCGASGRNRGFKLGPLPCSFVPSPSPMMPEMDVRPH
jgi:hypothetical protein